MTDKNTKRKPAQKQPKKQKPAAPKARKGKPRQNKKSAPLIPFVTLLAHFTCAKSVFLCRFSMNEIAILSYPKCGRTWLRLMLGRALTLHFNLADADLLELDALADREPRIPRLCFSHDGPANLQTAVQIHAQTKQEYACKPVILLVRDPADIIISYYFEYTRRRIKFNPAHFPDFNGDLSAFLRQERGGLDSIIAFYQNWAAHRYVPTPFLVLRYEDMHADPARALWRVLTFSGLPDVSEATIEAAVDYGRFDNMRHLEQQNGLNAERLQPGDPADPESYKTRRGQVGGYVDYLSDADLAYVLEKRRQMPSLYGYN